MCVTCNSKANMNEENPDGNGAPPINLFSVMGAQHKLVSANKCTSLENADASSDDEEESVLSYDNSALDAQEPTVNVVNSKEVVIGSVTQFHGPVTIVQHGTTTELPALKEKEAQQNNGANLVTSDGITTEKVYSVRKCVPKRILVYFACITLLLVIITLTLIYTLNSSTPDISDVTEAPYEYVGSHTIIPRSAWGARDPKYIVNMTHPAQYVIISHTVGPVCKSIKTCSEIMRNIQSYHVGSLPTSDIGYNFVIGGDGNIYEGRGWDRQNFHEDRSVGVCFTGNYVYNTLTPEMEDALVELLKEGVRKKVLMPNYRLIAHNQTMATQSPGVNVYKFIKTLPNFYPDRTPESRDR